MAPEQLPPSLLDEISEVVFRETDPCLRARQVEELVARHPEHAAAVRAMADPQAIPASIGPFRILALLGQGGFGSVYRAQQTRDVDRVVALKVLSTGVDSHAVLARFEIERRVLASMNHDAIARFFEAGQANDQLWFSMELVEGRPLTRYCDDHQLSISDRVRLFVQVCDGVQHAHSKGIVHRDLKPANVLVSHHQDAHVAKIIDFGIARATDRSLSPGAPTVSGMVLGTPEYMAPEQCGGDPIHIDARTDVYALGAMLYEMVTGTLPFAASELPRTDLLTMQRVLLENDPQKPSTRIAALAAGGREPARMRQSSTASWRRAVAGDLDDIVGRAMEKDPARRYPSVADLAADLRRHLDHEPIVARPPSSSYRLRKFVRRYRSQVVVVAAVLAIAVSGAIAWTVTRDAAERERIRRQRVDEEVRIELARAEAVVAQTGANREADARLWPQVLELTRVAQQGARASDDADLRERTQHLLSDVEAKAASFRRAEDLARDKRDLLETLEMAFLSGWPPSLMVNDSQTRLVAQCKSSLLLGKDGLLVEEVRGDAAYVEQVAPLVHLLLSDACLQRRSLRRAYEALGRASLLAALPREDVARQMRVADETVEWLRTLAARAFVDDSGLNDLHGRFLDWDTRDSPPPAMADRRPGSVTESLVLANYLGAFEAHRTRARRDLKKVSEAKVPNRPANLCLARIANANGTPALHFVLATSTPRVAASLMWSIYGDESAWGRSMGLQVYQQDRSPGVRAGLSLNLASHEEYERAREILAGLDRAACDALECYWVSLALEALLDKDQALAWTEASVAKAPLHARGWCNIGWYRLRVRDYAGAVAARRIGHVIGSAQDDWRYPSEAWLQEAEAFAREPQRFEVLLHSPTANATDSDLALTFRYAELTEQVDDGIRLYDRLRVERPQLVDPLVNRFSVQAAGLAARAGQRATDSTERERWDRVTYEILHQAMERVWPAAVEGRAERAAERFAFWVQDYVALQRFRCSLARYPLDQATAWEQFWRRVQLLQ